MPRDDRTDDDDQADDEESDGIGPDPAAKFGWDAGDVEVTPGPESADDESAASKTWTY